MQLSFSLQPSVNKWQNMWEPQFQCGFSWLLIFALTEGTTPRQPVLVAADAELNLFIPHPPRAEFIQVVLGSGSRSSHPQQTASRLYPTLKPSFRFLQVRLYIWHSRTLMWYDKITQQTQNKYLSGSFFSEPLFKNFALYKQSLHLLFGNISNDDLYSYRFKCVLNFVSGKCT